MTREELASTREERADELDAEAATAHAEAASLRESKARFELFEDASGKPRWRLRHRNGNIIADSGEGYASRSNAVEAVTKVKANAPGADEETVA